MKFDRLVESVLSEDRGGAIFHAKNALKQLGYNLKGAKFGFKKGIVYLNGKSLVSDSDPESMHKWVKAAVEKDGPDHYGLVLKESKDIDDFDHVVKWTDRDYKPHTKVFKENPQGPPENSLKAARKFVNKLEKRNDIRTIRIVSGSEWKKEQ